MISQVITKETFISKTLTILDWVKVKNVNIKSQEDVSKLELRYFIYRDTPFIYIDQLKTIIIPKMYEAEIENIKNSEIKLDGWSVKAVEYKNSNFKATKNIFKMSFHLDDDVLNRKTNEEFVTGVFNIIDPLGNSKELEIWKHKEFWTTYYVSFEEKRNWMKHSKNDIDYLSKLLTLIIEKYGERSN